MVSRNILCLLGVDVVVFVLDLLLVGTKKTIFAAKRITLLLMRIKFDSNSNIASLPGGIPFFSFVIFYI